MATGELSGRAPAMADEADGGRPAEEPRQQAKLVFASFLMLFTELALIRWITANNVFITEATNFVLLASFLGIGIGFLNARSGRDYLRWTPVALLALVATGFLVVHQWRTQHAQQGEQARRQVIEALRVTSEKLDLAWRVVKDKEHSGA